MLEETAVLYSFFDKEKYLTYNKYVSGLELEAENKIILDTISEYFTAHPDVNKISANEFKIFFRKKHPILKTKDVILEMLNSFESEPVSEKTFLELLKDVLNKHYASEIITGLTPVLEGAYNSTLDIVYDSLETYEEAIKTLDTNDPNEAFITDDLQVLLDHRVLGDGIKWRLNCLNNDIGDLRGGSLGHVFARSNAGKTTLIMSEAAFFASQLKDDEEILIINNEEDGEEKAIRKYSAITGLSKADLVKNKDEAERLYKKLGGHKIKILDQAIISISEIEAELKKRNVRVLIIDQGAKVFLTGGSDMSTHERLAKLWLNYRELGKRYGCDVITVGQADAAAEGKKWLRQTNMDSSKVGIPGELDYAVGIGLDFDSPDYIRFICLCKNKMKDGNHGRYQVTIDVMAARFTDVPIKETCNRISSQPEEDSKVHTPSTMEKKDLF